MYRTLHYPQIGVIFSEKEYERIYVMCLMSMQALIDVWLIFTVCSGYCFIMFYQHWSKKKKKRNVIAVHYRIHFIKTETGPGILCVPLFLGKNEVLGEMFQKSLYNFSSCASGRGLKTICWKNFQRKLIILYGTVVHAMKIYASISHFHFHIIISFMFNIKLNNEKKSSHINSTF